MKILTRLGIPLSSSAVKDAKGILGLQVNTALRSPAASKVKLVAAQ